MDDPIIRLNSLIDRIEKVSGINSNLSIEPENSGEIGQIISRLENIVDALESKVHTGPEIEPSSFYGKAAFEDIVDYISSERHLRLANQINMADSLGVARRTISNWMKRSKPFAEVVLIYQRKYLLQLPEIDPGSFYGRESIYRIMQHIVNQRVIHSQTPEIAAESLDIGYSRMIKWKRKARGDFFMVKWQVLLLHEN